MPRSYETYVQPDGDKTAGWFHDVELTYENVLNGTLQQRLHTLDFPRVGTRVAVGSLESADALASSAHPACVLTLSTASTNTTTSVTLTATMNPTAATGNVKFYDGSTLLGTSALSSGVATLAHTFAGGVSAHILQAKYQGDSTHDAVDSEVQELTIALTTTSIVLTEDSASPQAHTVSVVLTGTVTPSASTGNVSFYDGATLLGTAALSSGAASLAGRTFTAGSHTLKAVYVGDTDHATSTSANVTWVST